MVLGEIQGSRYHGLGCGPNTEIKYTITTCASVNAIGGTIFSTLIFIVPPVKLTKAQVVILYLLRISIVSFNRVTSEILVN